ncbi:MAG TPA: thiamine pyrophosphate-dependent dehydrogenase E1 component subunit alpha [Candidatus Polarisedimenticolia bacterium]|nr:thiamine pyrophosphate-dependent dehydrogenase E1 component subunit alpha [Candidatus Polarisedimenticolia bacterium]
MKGGLKPGRGKGRRRAGSLDPDLARLLPGPIVPIRDPGLGRERLLAMHRLLRLNRMVEEKLSALYRQGQVVGGLYSSLGQEAISVGSACALAPDDLLAPMIRNIGSLLARGVAPRDLFLQFLARQDGPTHGKDGTLHFGNVERRALIGPISHLGTLIPVMAGAALAARQRGERRVALTYIGDGGTSTGDFHEGLNLAAVLRLPLILVVENNGYAYSTPTFRQFAVASLAERGPAYGCASESLDGTDVLAVFAATARAVERGRRGDGPTLLECRAFRMRGHAEHDDMHYVPKELLEAWRRRDPLDRFEAFLVEAGHATADDLKAVAGSLAPLLEREARAAQESPHPAPAEALKGVTFEPGYESPWWPSP